MLRQQGLRVRAGAFMEGAQGEEAEFEYWGMAQGRGEENRQRALSLLPGPASGGGDRARRESLVDSHLAAPKAGPHRVEWWPWTSGKPVLHGC